MVDIDQIFVFQQWHHATFIRIPTNTKDDILYTFNEEERYKLFNYYIAEDL